MSVCVVSVCVYACVETEIEINIYLTVALSDLVYFLLLLHADFSDRETGLLCLCVVHFSLFWGWVGGGC